MTQTQTQAQTDELWTVQQAADYMGVEVQTVRRWINEGRLKAKRLTDSGPFRISKLELMNALKQSEKGEKIE